MVSRIVCRGSRRAGAVLVAMLVPASLASHAWAQQFTPQVNPGAISRQNQQVIQSLPELKEIPHITGPVVTAPGQPATQKVPPGGPTFVLRRVVFSRSALLPQPDVEAKAASYIGRRVDLSQIYDIVNAINALYEKRGIPNASAILPPQHVSDGVVHIELVEGRLGKVDVKGNTYIPKDFVTGRATMAAGAVVNVPQLSHDIAVFNRINDMQIRAALQPGARFGQTDVTFSVLEPPRDTLDFVVDNWGLNSTGVYEGEALFRRRSFVVPDDSLTIYGIGNPGDLSGDVNYQLPIDRFGGRLGLGYGYTRTRVLYGPYRSLAITGHSQFGSVQLNQPFYANERWLLSGLLNWSIISSSTDQGDTLQTTDLTNKGGPGLLVSYIDAKTVAELTFSYAYGGTHYGLIDSSSRFNLLSGTYQFRYLLPADFSMNLAGAWQYTGASVLPPDQLLSIGGPTSVRGYDANLVAGFSGGYDQFELHKDVTPLVKGLNLFSFVDAGTVSAPSTSNKTLLGVGFGTSYAIGRWVDIQLETGWPLERVVPNQSSFAVYFRVIVHAI
jgi:hemolysin activation/secretion protein